ncbi:MAG TPA: HTTM domain-containing protein [Saprospiraceae bacterium]|nr:HTTM domain-containing protein [Saprospiraceae bacterium]HMQ85828.1 HTTM domain-containing protein [Saprospiraceae bacterium]
MAFLFKPVPIASLVFFRIVFGILGFSDVLSTWIYYHLMSDAYNPDKFRFKYYGFEWAEPLGGQWIMSAFFFVLCVLGLLVAIGKWYRLSATLFAFGFTYTYLLEKAHYLNHGYLFCWICFLMIFLPAHRQFSADVWKKPALRQDHIPFWCLFLLPFLMGVVYFYGGIAKINPDWLQAVPLKQWLDQRAGLPVIGKLLVKDQTAYFMAYGGLLLDLTAAFLLSFRKTRLFVFAAIIFFHLSNLLVFSIGIFPMLSLSLSALYFAPDFPLKIWNRLTIRFPSWKRINSWWEKKTAIPEPAIPMWQARTNWQPFIAVGVGLLMAVHLLIPLRHHLFPGDVTWTEEGHRYSWRMMLRHKSGHGHFMVVDKASGEATKVRPIKYLDSSKQLRKIFTHPDMILQFAHYLHDIYQAEGKDVAVYAEVDARLNYGIESPYIDPEVDLTQVKWAFFKTSPWILPEKMEVE